MEYRESPFVFTPHGTYAVLKLFPLINEGQWGNVSEIGTEVIAKLEERAVPKLLVDLSQLEYMGSAQVALLVRIWKSLKRTNGKLVVFCPHAMVLEVLTLAGLKSLWEIVPTEEEALGILGVSVGTAPRSKLAGWLLSGIGLLAGGALCGLRFGVQSPNIPNLRAEGLPILACVSLLFSVCGALLLFVRNPGTTRIWASLALLLSLALTAGGAVPLPTMKPLAIANPSAAQAVTPANSTTDSAADPTTTAAKP